MVTFYRAIFQVIRIGQPIFIHVNLFIIVKSDPEPNWNFSRPIAYLQIFFLSQ